MSVFKYCFIVLTLVVLSNAIDQNTTKYNDLEVDGPYEEDYGSDDSIELDFYPDSDYENWKPFPGRNFYIFITIFHVMLEAAIIILYFML
jgi:hypothetical protein